MSEIESPGETKPQHRTVIIQKNLLEKNAQQAQMNRQRFQSQGAFTLNLLSAPGSGKTMLLERMLDDFGRRHSMAVLVGDLQTENDARRMAGRGHSIVAITTGNVCHLEAEMIDLAAREVDLDGVELVVIENVGNLVCPASFDLGEDLRVVMLSTTEGEDKPLKYPKAFKTAQAVVINKCDLADVVGFDRSAAIENIRGVAPGASIFEVSARTGTGLDAWYEFLERQLANALLSRSAAVAPRSEDRDSAAARAK